MCMYLYLQNALFQIYEIIIERRKPRHSESDFLAIIFYSTYQKTI